MDIKQLHRLRSINDMKRAMLELNHAQLRQGISDGLALAQKYRALDCGTGVAAELGLTHVARSLGVIERGLAALRQQEATVRGQLVALATARDRLAELHQQAQSEADRRLADAELSELVEEQVGRLKFGVSVMTDGPGRGS